MALNATRRELLVGAGLVATAAAFPVLAQDKPKLRFSAVFSEQDIRAEMMKMFADAIEDDFTFEGYYGGNLFKQGTERTRSRRGTSWIQQRRDGFLSAESYRRYLSV